MQYNIFISHYIVFASTSTLHDIPSEISSRNSLNQKRLGVVRSDSLSILRKTLKKFSRTRHHVTNPSGKESARHYIKRALKKSGLHVWSEYIKTAQVRLVDQRDDVGILRVSCSSQICNGHTIVSCRSKCT